MKIDDRRVLHGAGVTTVYAEIEALNGSVGAAVLSPLAWQNIAPARNLRYSNNRLHFVRSADVVDLIIQTPYPLDGANDLYAVLDICVAGRMAAAPFGGAEEAKQVFFRGTLVVDWRAASSSFVGNTPMFRGQITSTYMAPNVGSRSGGLAIQLFNTAAPAFDRIQVDVTGWAYSTSDITDAFSVELNPGAFALTAPVSIDGLSGQRSILAGLTAGLVIPAAYTAAVPDVTWEVKNDLLFLTGVVGLAAGFLPNPQLLFTIPDPVFRARRVSNGVAHGITGNGVSIINIGTAGTVTHFTSGGAPMTAVELSSLPPLQIRFQ